MTGASKAPHTAPDRARAGGSRSSSYDELIAVEKRNYPSLEQATAALNSVVRDTYARLEHESAHEWFFRIVPSIQWLIRQDPELAVNLSKLFALPVKDVRSYAHLSELSSGKRLFLRAFDHTWALWAWSYWLRSLGTEAAGRPLLIHLDDHEDLRSPPLGCTEHPGVFRQPFGLDPFSLTSPNSVSAAIRRGFIGIGGFIVPFLHTLRACDILHFRFDSPAHRYYNLQALRLAEEPFASGSSVLHRPVAVMEDRESLSDAAPAYIRTNDLGLLAALPVEGRRVLLDIDMDFFCNKQEGLGEGGYNGAASIDDVCSTIDLLAATLGRSGIAPFIEVITLALSPGFFPSAYWAVALPRLEVALRNLFDL